MINLENYCFYAMLIACKCMPFYKKLNCDTKNEPPYLAITFTYVAFTIDVATLTWPSVGVKPNTWKSWGFGVLRDSRMFRARQKDPKHLALGCSWCHWKGLEA